MHTLYFIKFRNSKWSEIVFLVTAADPAHAEARGFDGIADQYRSEYQLIECTAVCQTPDTVDLFQPC